MKQIQACLIDLDGTMYHGNTMIDGADQLILRLRALQIPYLFVTNNSSATPAEVAQRLQRMGIVADEADVCTSAQATAAYVKDQFPADSRVFVIGETGLHHALSQRQVFISDHEAEVVVQGIDRQLTYAKLAQAVNIIRAGGSYILTNPDILLPSDHGLIPGAGSIAAMLKQATGVEPIVVGKPSQILMNFALQKLGVDSSKAWVIGDNPFTDIAAGQASACPTALVLTGLATPHNYKQLLMEANCQADQIFTTLHEVIAWINTSP